MYLATNEERWNEVHSSQFSKLKYPNETVVRFVKTQFHIPSKTHILDLGCGSGRHIFFLSNEGYQVSGIDFSKPCVDYVNSMLDKMNIDGRVQEGSVTSLPYPDNSFDGIICHGVLLYLCQSDIVRSIQEIHRTLKAGGKALVVVRQIQDLRYGKGNEIEPNTFRMTDNGTNEEGMLMHFFSIEEVHDLFVNFSEVRVGIHDFTMISVEQYNSDLIVTITK